MISRHILSLLSRTGAVLGDVARLVALVADGLLSALRGLVTVLVALVALNVTGAVSSDVTSGTAATASLLVGAFAGNVAEFTAVVAGVVVVTSESAANRSVATRASSGLALLLRIVVLIGLGRAISGEMSVTVAVVALNLSLVGGALVGAITS